MHTVCGVHRSDSRAQGCLEDRLIKVVGFEWEKCKGSAMLQVFSRERIKKLVKLKIRKQSISRIVQWISLVRKGRSRSISRKNRDCTTISGGGGR